MLDFKLSNTFEELLGQNRFFVIDDVLKNDRQLFQQLFNEGVLWNKTSFIEKDQLNECCLFLQPHSDDCALSCGGHMLLEYLKYKKRIILVTVFSNYSSSYFPYKNKVCLDHQKYSQLRKMEDMLVCDYLNAKLYCLNMPEAPLRKIGYPILQGGLFKKDYTWMDKIFLNLKKIIDLYKPSTVYLPCGIGMHCDHVILTEVAKQLSYKNNSFLFNKIYFYEDYPYCDESRFDYWRRIEQLKTQLILEPSHIDITHYFEKKAILINFYKSQFLNWPYTKIKKDIEKLAISTRIESNFIYNQKNMYSHAERTWKLQQK